jgi:integrase
MGERMARNVPMLGVPELIKITKPGRHACGDKLYMEIPGTHGGRRRWLVRYTYNDSPTWLTLGEVDTGRWDASLLHARQRAKEALDALARGEDPATSRTAPAGNVGPRGRITFGECVGDYLSSHEMDWTNAVHREQWRSTVRSYAKPIWHRPVADLTVSEVKSCLEPHWRRVPVTAQRTRARIAAVFDFAIGQEWRTAGNPATAKVIGQVLGNGVHNGDDDEKHHAALPWKKLPRLMAKLEKPDYPAALALRFLILTAVRTNGVRGMRWDEVDKRNKVWTVPRSRNKGRTLRVPLSTAALQILDSRTRIEGDPFVFGNLGPNAIRDTLVREGGYSAGECTAHGMRSTFKDWCEDNKVCDDKVSEAALSHKIKSKSKRAYLRTDYLDERRKVMEAWGCYLMFE